MPYWQDKRVIVPIDCSSKLPLQGANETMVLKVVGIVSSPRKEMNTDTLVTKVLEGAQSIGAKQKKSTSMIWK